MPEKEAVVAAVRFSIILAAEMIVQFRPVTLLNFIKHCSKQSVCSLQHDWCTIHKGCSKQFGSGTATLCSNNSYSHFCTFTSSSYS